jgi:hypothetical protein
MTDLELEKLEAELRMARPARPSAELMRRLLAAQPVDSMPPARLSSPIRQPWASPRWLWWFVPTTALVALLAGIAGRHLPDSGAAGVSANVSHTNSLTLKADDIQIDHELVGSSETIADLPDGLPVRFQVQAWRDRVIFSDKRRGVEIEEQTPRVEIIPVRFETY